MNKATCPVLIALLPLVFESVAYADEATSDTSSAQSPTEKVVISGSREAEQNYRVPAVDSIGPLGSTPILDTPYSIGILDRKSVV